jgi:hypothetical protein
MAAPSYTSERIPQHPPLSPHDEFLLQYSPAWYRTPFVQTVTLGLVFFFVFTSYTTIQFYARSTYGAELAANSVSAVYASFTLACLVAPTLVNLWGSRIALCAGILGYAALVAASLIYFVVNYDISATGDVRPRMGWIVVLGGAILGCGAALLWTAQGRLLLQYAARAETLAAGSSADLIATNDSESCSTKPTTEGPSHSGMLLGVFWAVFQCSSLAGGAMSFVYYSQKPSGSVLLYAIFLGFILLGAMSTQLLLPPSLLTMTTRGDDGAVETAESVATTEETTLLPHEKLPEDANSNVSTASSWWRQVNSTIQVFCTKPILMLSALFFYTGFNQPYQQSTFGNRFVTKRTIGVELIVFHLAEIVGALFCGRALDCNASDSTKGRRWAAIRCLLLFMLVNTLGNALALIQEYESLQLAVVEALDITDWLTWRPTLAFGCWGFADAQIQVYCYWLLNTLYSTDDDHSRAVGFYKCIQSLGVSIGFSLTPLTRLTALHQLWLSTAVYAVGTGLAFTQLPQRSRYQ